MTTEPETSPADLAERVGRLEALAEIQQLYLDYGRHLDAGDAASYAGLFAKDAKLRLGPVMRADGRAAIAAVAAGVVRTAAEGGNKTVHLLGSPRITLDGDKAVGECVWMAITNSVAGPPPIRVGRHVDELIREDGRWRFAKRVGHIDVGAVSRVSATPASPPDVATQHVSTENVQPK
jgi:uncharacterized protein (TIGR02246 family)